MTMRFDIITIFPNAFESYFSTSILKRAQEKKRVKIVAHNLRDYTTDKHKTVDDKPYGGGAGMVMKAEPIFKAVSALKKLKIRNPRSETNSKSKSPKSKTILLAASGKQFDQRMAEKLSKLDHIIFICGHYEGVDERVMNVVDEVVSVGPYVLTGGELPTMTIVDAVTRLIPGVLGNPKSLDEESFGGKREEGLKIGNLKLEIHGEYPHYTRPELVTWKGKRYRVPAVLLSGDHTKIMQWRGKKMGRTRGKGVS